MNFFGRTWTALGCRATARFRSIAAFQARADQTERWDFLEGEFLSSSISGALQHSHTYANASNKDREKLQSVLREKLCELAAKYSTEVAITTEEHLKNIQELASHAKKNCAHFLVDGKLRLGVAAKALNLYLKYLWCVGKLKVPPPHCPFDHTVIYDLLGFQDNWTEVDDPATYLKWVKKAEELRDDAKCESLAQWELRRWNAAQPGGKAGCKQGSSVEHTS